MPSSDKHITDGEHEALLAKIEANKGKHKAENPDRVELDYAALSAAAMNRHTTSPEFTARYKKWLEYLDPDLLTPLAKADYEQILAEEAAAKQAEAKE
jgi:hypothetical protein